MHLNCTDKLLLIFIYALIYLQLKAIDAKMCNGKEKMDIKSKIVNDVKRDDCVHHHQKRDTNKLQKENVYMKNNEMYFF